MSEAKNSEASLANRMVQHFVSEPDARLDRISVKALFAVSGAQVDGLLRPAIDAGAIAVVHDEDLGRIWTAGPHIGRFTHLSGFKGWLEQRGKRETARQPALPDPDELRARIEPGVAIPAKLPSAVVRYHSVLSVMASGDSFTVAKEVSRKLMKTVMEWGKRHGRTFLLRDIDSSTSRIWRVDGMEGTPETEIATRRRGGRKPKAGVAAAAGGAGGAP